jgi:hypothetical protein
MFLYRDSVKVFQELILNDSARLKYLAGGDVWLTLNNNHAIDTNNWVLASKILSSPQKSIRAYMRDTLNGELRYSWVEGDSIKSAYGMVNPENGKPVGPMRAMNILNGCYEKTCKWILHVQKQTDINTGLIILLFVWCAFLQYKQGVK